MTTPIPAIRDPRIDPRPGDVVERNGVTREVTDVRDGCLVTFFHAKRGREEEGTLTDLTLSVWRARTAGATILNRGDWKLANECEERKDGE